MQKKFSKAENQERFQASIQFFPDFGDDVDAKYSDDLIKNCSEWQRIMADKSRSMKEMIQLANHLSYMSRMILDEIADGQFERE